MPVKNPDTSISFTMLQFPQKIRKCITGLSSSYLEGTELKPQHLKYVAVIAFCDGISQKDLAEKTLMDKSSVSYMVKELTDLGLVYNSGSGKVSSLRLTEEGRRAAVLAWTIGDLLEERIMSCMAPEERQQFVASVRKIVARVDELNSEFDDVDS
ncbi:MAG: winged helix-turn-helix transcriptional regulator [Thermoplasmata archaeon]|nr:winged helix-turn-helix transcriptional regulator [Thermoplasmata archaeon]